MIRAWTPPQDIVRLLRSILGPFLIEVWLAENAELTSGEVSIWRGLLKGAVLPAVGAARPAFAVDGTKFGGKKVIQTAITGTKVLWANNTLSGLAASGSRPVLSVRGRMRTTAGNQRMCGFGGASGRSLEWYVQTNFVLSDMVGIGPSAGAANTSVHTLTGYTDGTNAHARLDGVDHVTVEDSSLQSAITYGSVGVYSFDGSSAPADLSCAAIMLLSASPGAARLAAAENALAGYYPA